MSVLSKVPTPEGPDPKREFAIEDDGFGEQYPGLFEIIARIRWEGKKRKTGKILLFVDQGKASLCLSDVATGQVAFYKSNGFLEALEGIERALQEGTVDWRTDRRSRG